MPAPTSACSQSGAFAAAMWTSCPRRTSSLPTSRSGPTCPSPPAELPGDQQLRHGRRPAALLAQEKWESPKPRRVDEFVAHFWAFDSPPGPARGPMRNDLRRQEVRFAYRLNLPNCHRNKRIAKFKNHS